MKAFFLLIFVFLLFIVFTVSGLANVNLTSSGPTAVQAASSPQVLTIQNSAPNYQVPVPVTGSTTCTNPFVVKSGDSLSQIATLCNTSMAAIQAANPQITNPNLIYPGQSLVIPSGNAQPVLVTPVPVTGNTNNQVVPNLVPTAQMQPIFPTPTAEVAANVVPQTALLPQLAPNGSAFIRPGTPLQVKALNYPPNTPVNIAIGPQNTGYNIVAAGITDASGTVISTITIPGVPNSAVPYVVVVVTSRSPVIQAMSQPFYIGPASANP